MNLISSFVSFRLKIDPINQIAVNIKSSKIEKFSKDKKENLIDLRF